MSIKQIEIIPLVSAGDIWLGMERSEARQLLGKHKEYRQFPNDENTIDAFDFCHVAYTADNLVEFVMLHDFVNLQVYYNKQRLDNMSQSELISFFYDLDEDIDIESYTKGEIVGIVSFESNKLGVAAYWERDVEYLEDGSEIWQDKLASISVAIRDYWK